jgi:hypothetical protein
MTILLLQSLFNTYADLMIGMLIFNENKFQVFPIEDIKHSSFIYSPITDQIATILRHQLQSIHQILLNLSHDSTYFHQIKRTEIFFRLLKCKWNRL